jgi:hypothetical protein
MLASLASAAAVHRTDAGAAVLPGCTSPFPGIIAVNGQPLPVALDAFRSLSGPMRTPSD